MKKTAAYLIIASMLLQGVTVPVLAHNAPAAVNGENRMDRGLIAAAITDGIYLSWRLQTDEDNRFGTADSNVLFNIYRDGELIAAEESTTNYIDKNGSADSEYYVVPVIDGEEAEEEIKTARAFVSGSNYFDIPLVLPEDETITDSSGNENTYSFNATDCSTGDLDGDGEYEIVVKFVSHELDVGSAGYSGTVRFNAYKLDGTRMWEQDINLGRNVFSSAHTAQFLVYDFDGDGKAEITCQTSLGSVDSTGEYVSRVSGDSSISSLTDEENAAADFRESGNGRITTGQEFLTVFSGETGEAIDTINYPTQRYNVSCWGKSDGGNRSLRFLADVAYLDGEKPYAVYWRGYYNHDNGRTGVAGVSFDGARLSVDYIFDTRSDQPGYTAGNEKYAGEGNHNLTVADVDKDGRDEIISGAMCMEINEDNKLMPKWCTFLGHGDALHIGDYDPTHDGYEFFTVHEEGGVESEGITLDFGMSVIDAETGEIMFHQSNTKDTGRGMMANVGSGGYYQITGIGTYQSNGGTDFTPVNNGMGNNFRIFWDGDLYDELLNSTEITSWNGRTMAAVFNAVGCVSINSTKANPSLQADILGDWREEVIYPLTDSSALRVFTTTDHTDYKMKSLMYDRVYRSGVAAEQTAYNQPPHIGYYLSEDCFYGTLTALEINTDNAKTEYHVGEALDISGLSVTAQYSDAEEREVTNYAVSGYDPMIAGGQQITVTYLGMSESYSVSVTAEQDIEVKCENSTLYAGTEFTKDMLNVTMLYKNGDAVRVKDFSVSEVDTLSTGSRTVTITHKGVQGIYRKDIELNIITDITADKNGMVTGYTGENEEVTIPSSMTIDASYRIKSIEGNLISLEMADTVPDVYAAAYDQTGRLEKVKLFRLDGSGRVTLDAGFEADKVFIWDGMKPTENDGAVTVEISSIEDGALKDSRIKKLYIYNDELEFKGDDIFPEGIVIVCHESSTAYEYAAAHNIETELIKEGDKITFDEDFYQAYSGSGILMQTMNAAYLAADHVTYNTHAADSRAPWYTANTYGFKLASENGDNYLYVNAGIYDQNNQFNQIYITLNEPKQISEKQTVSFDIKLPSNSGSPYVEMQNAEGTVIDTISANAAGLSNDVWYRYEMEYDGSGYTRRIYNEDGSVKSETALSAAASGTVLSHIVFKQDFTMGSGSIKTGLVYVDNIILN